MQFLKFCKTRCWYPVVPPLHLTKKIKIVIPMFLAVERHCFDKRNGFQQFLQRLKQLNAISEVLIKFVGRYHVVPPLHLTKKIEIVIPSFYEWKDIVLIKEVVFNNF